MSDGDDRASRLRDKRNKSKKKVQESSEESPGESDDSGSGKDSSKRNTTERKQLAMYLPEDTANALRDGFNRYKLEHPNATKNNDFYPAVIEKGLEVLGVDE